MSLSVLLAMVWLVYFQAYPDWLAAISGTNDPAVIGWVFVLGAAVIPISAFVGQVIGLVLPAILRRD
jgi:hypothetical protein